MAKWLLHRIRFPLWCAVAQERGRISEKDKDVGLAGFRRIVEISCVYHYVLRMGRSADVADIITYQPNSSYTIYEHGENKGRAHLALPLMFSAY